MKKSDISFLLYLSSIGWVDKYNSTQERDLFKLGYVDLKDRYVRLSKDGFEFLEQSKLKDFSDEY